MANRKCAVPQVVRSPGEPGFQIIESPIPAEIPANHVLLRVLACGICHSDTTVVLGMRGVKFPAVPGHEVIGRVVRVGAGDVARAFEVGSIVGVGWHADHCSSCEACTDGDFICCERLKVCGLDIPGGYQDYMVAPAKGLARVPEGMDPVKAAPIMCAGVTVFNSLRRNNEYAKPPALVAVVGIGGLGHLAIQYAAKMGYTVVAISRGTDKKDYALQLGASYYINSREDRVAESLKGLGGAKVVLSTAPDSKTMGDCIDGLSRNGRLVVLGHAREPTPLLLSQLIRKRKSIVGFPAGTCRDSQDALEFAHLNGIEPRTVVFDGVDKAPEAYAAMIRGEYRVVLKIAHD
ncbi:unnamed protein product [Ascophyllum nodosum]